MIKKIKDFLKGYTRIFLSLLSILAVFGFFRFLGWKGIVGFLVGLTVMAYLFLSKSLMIRVLLEKFSGTEEYIDVVNK